MTDRTFLRLGCAATALILLFATYRVCAADGEPRDYYSYYKTPVPLTLETQRVAVRAPGIQDEQDLAEVLAPFGMVPGDVSGRPLNGWLTISTPAAARTDPGARALIRQLSGPEAIRFVSPVFTNEDGWPIMITPDLFVGFAAGVSAERAEAILRAAGAGEITDRDYARMDGVYRLRSAFTNGFDVLDAANALAKRPEVRSIRPADIATTNRPGAALGSR